MAGWRDRGRHVHAVSVATRKPVSGWRKPGPTTPRLGLASVQRPQRLAPGQDPDELSSRAEAPAGDELRARFTDSLRDWVEGTEDEQFPLS